MSLIPWDDIFFNIKGRSNELNNIYTDYLAHRDKLNLQGDALRGKLENLQIMNLHNNALLIVISIGDMKDSDYHKYLADTLAAKPNNPSMPMVASVLAGLSELGGTLVLAKGLFNLGKIGITTLRSFASASKNAVDLTAAFEDEAVMVADEIAVTETGEAAATSIINAASEAGVEIGSDVGITATVSAMDTATIAAVETASSATRVIAVTGVGIMISLGIDMIIGVIAGLEEDADITKETNSLNDAVEGLSTFIQKIDSKLLECDSLMLKEMDNFIIRMKILNAIQPATFNWNITPNLSNMQLFVDAAASAADQYVFIVNVRTSFTDYFANWITDNPGDVFGKNEFMGWKSFEVTMRPKGLTAIQAKQFIDYVIQNSPEMKNFTI